MKSKSNSSIFLLFNDKGYTDEVCSYLKNLNYSVVCAKSTKDAEQKIKEKHFDIAIIQITNKLLLEREEFIRKTKFLIPNISFLVVSAQQGLFEEIISLDIGKKIVKPENFSKYEKLISYEMYLKSLNKKKREIHFEMFNPIPLKHRCNPIRLVSKYPSKDLERFDGIIDNDQEKLRWVSVDYPERDEKKGQVTISVASCIGCRYNCEFCLSRFRTFKRPLGPDEIISQVIHGFNSYLFKGFLEKSTSKKASIYFACEGDALLDNYENTITAIKFLSKINMISHFVITTIGERKKLELVLKGIEKFPKTLWYWSVHSLNVDVRKSLMPRASQKIKAVRDQFLKISQLTKQKVTIAYMLIPGINDSNNDIALLKEYFGNDSKENFIIKLSKSITENFTNDFIVNGSPISPSSDKDIQCFQSKLESNGVNSYIAPIKGSKYGAGCGSTTPCYNPTEIDISENRISR